MTFDQSETRTAISPVLPATSRKRKKSEIADSESENDGVSDQEFGWGVEDEALNADSLLE